MNPELFFVDFTINDNIVALAVDSDDAIYVLDNYNRVFKSESGEKGKQVAWTGNAYHYTYALYISDKYIIVPYKSDEASTTVTIALFDKVTYQKIERNLSQCDPEKSTKVGDYIFFACHSKAPQKSYGYLNTKTGFTGYADLIWPNPSYSDSLNAYVLPATVNEDQTITFIAAGRTKYIYEYTFDPSKKTMDRKQTVFADNLYRTIYPLENKSQYLSISNEKYEIYDLKTQELLRSYENYFGYSKGVCSIINQWGRESIWINSLNQNIFFDQDKEPELIHKRTVTERNLSIDCLSKNYFPYIHSVNGKASYSAKIGMYPIGKRAPITVDLGMKETILQWDAEIDLKEDISFDKPDPFDLKTNDFGSIRLAVDKEGITYATDHRELYKIDNGVVTKITHGNTRRVVLDFFQTDETLAIVYYETTDAYSDYVKVAVYNKTDLSFVASSSMRSNNRQYMRIKDKLIGSDHERYYTTHPMNDLKTAVVSKIQADVKILGLDGDEPYYEETETDYIVYQNGTTSSQLSRLTISKDFKKIVTENKIYADNKSRSVVVLPGHDKFYADGSIYDLTTCEKLVTIGPYRPTYVDTNKEGMTVLMSGLNKLSLDYNPYEVLSDSRTGYLRRMEQKSYIPYIKAYNETTKTYTFDFVHLKPKGNQLLNLKENICLTTYTKDLDLSEKVIESAKAEILLKENIVVGQKEDLLLTEEVNNGGTEQLEVAESVLLNHMTNNECVINVGKNPSITRSKNHIGIASENKAFSISVDNGKSFSYVMRFLETSHIALSPNGLELAVVSNSQLMIYDFLSLSPLIEQPISGFKMFPDGKVLFTEHYIIGDDCIVNRETLEKKTFIPIIGAYDYRIYEADADNIIIEYYPSGLWKTITKYSYCFSKQETKILEREEVNYDKSNVFVDWHTVAFYDESNITIKNKTTGQTLLSTPIGVGSDSKPVIYRTIENNFVLILTSNNSYSVYINNQKIVSCASKQLFAYQYTTDFDLTHLSVYSHNDYVLRTIQVQCFTGYDKLSLAENILASDVLNLIENIEAPKDFTYLYEKIFLYGTDHTSVRENIITGNSVLDLGLFEQIIDYTNGTDKLDLKEYVTRPWEGLVRFNLIESVKFKPGEHGSGSNYTQVVERIDIKPYRDLSVLEEIKTWEEIPPKEITLAIKTISLRQEVNGYNKIFTPNYMPETPKPHVFYKYTTTVYPASIPRQLRIYRQPVDLYNKQIDAYYEYSYDWHEVVPEDLIVKSNKTLKATAITYGYIEYELEASLTHNLSIQLVSDGIKGFDLRKVTLMTKEDFSTSLSINENVYAWNQDFRVIEYIRPSETDDKFIADKYLSISENISGEFGELSMSERVISEEMIGNDYARIAERVIYAIPQRSYLDVLEEVVTPESQGYLKAIETIVNTINDRAYYCFNHKLYSYDEAEGQTNYGEKAITITTDFFASSRNIYWIKTHVYVDPTYTMKMIVEFYNKLQLTTDVHIQLVVGESDDLNRLDRAYAITPVLYYNKSTYPEMFSSDYSFSPTVNHLIANHIEQRGVNKVCFVGFILPDGGHLTRFDLANRAEEKSLKLTETIDPYRACDKLDHYYADDRAKSVQEVYSFNVSQDLHFKTKQSKIKKAYMEICSKTSVPSDTVFKDQDGNVLKAYIDSYRNYLTETEFYYVSEITIRVPDDNSLVDSIHFNMTKTIYVDNIEIYYDGLSNDETISMRESNFDKKGIDLSVRESIIMPQIEKLTLHETLSKQVSAANSLLARERVIRPDDIEGSGSIGMKEYVDQSMTKNAMRLWELVPSDTQQDSLSIYEIIDEMWELMPLSERVYKTNKGVDGIVMVEIIK